MNSAFYTTFHTMLAEKGAKETARQTREYGFGSAEYYCDAVVGSSVIPDAAAAGEVRLALENEGLYMACVSVAYDAIACPDAESVMRKYAEIAKELGSPFLHHTLLIHPVKADGQSEIRRKLSLAADAAVRIANMADAFGLTCLYEDQGMYVNGVENFSVFFEDVKSRASNVGVCADLGNILYSGEKPVPFLTRFVGDTKHVHIKDCTTINEEGVRRIKNVPFGEGEVDIPACLAVLKGAGYSGDYALELTPELSTDDGISAAIHYLSDKM